VTRIFFEAADLQVVFYRGFSFSPSIAQMIDLMYFTRSGKLDSSVKRRNLAQLCINSIELGYSYQMKKVWSKQSLYQI
jgi:hypothetical protein